MSARNDTHKGCYKHAIDNEWAGLPDLFDRDFAWVLLPDLDYDAQLVAVHSLLDLHKELDQTFAVEIREIEEHIRQSKGLREEHFVEEWVDRVHSCAYQDAARSMAAVGMLAPLMETVFYQTFQAARRYLSDTADSRHIHERWQRSSEERWDCHFVWKGGRRKRDVTEGILELAEAIDLRPYLPDDLESTLTALFGYRNKMFHFGFEWPTEERERFSRRIDSAEWPADWFSKSTRGEELWIFYLTESFSAHCLKTIEDVIEGIGAFVRENGKTWNLNISSEI